MKHTERPFSPASLQQAEAQRMGSQHGVNSRYNHCTVAKAHEIIVHAECTIHVQSYRFDHGFGRVPLRSIVRDRASYEPADTYLLLPNVYSRAARNTRGLPARSTRSLIVLAQIVWIFTPAEPISQLNLLISQLESSKSYHILAHQSIQPFTVSLLQHINYILNEMDKQHLWKYW